MKIEIQIQRIGGLYSVVVEAPSGACVADAVPVEGVLRCIALAVVSELQESLDLHDMDFGEFSYD